MLSNTLNAPPQNYLMSPQRWERIRRLCLCGVYTGIRITSGKLICNTRLKRQLLKKASCILYCHGGFISPLKWWWYLTPPLRSHTHTHACARTLLPRVWFHVGCASLLFSAEHAEACATLGCQSNCTATHDGPLCYCNSGYEIAADGKACKGERVLYTQSNQTWLPSRTWWRGMWRRLEMSLKHHPTSRWKINAYSRIWRQPCASCNLAVQRCCVQTQLVPFPLPRVHYWLLTLLPADFDECNVYGTCSQTCTNTEGSYICSCVEGYLLQPDNRSCKAKNGENATHRGIK